MKPGDLKSIMMTKPVDGVATKTHRWEAKILPPEEGGTVSRVIIREGIIGRNMKESEVGPGKIKGSVDEFLMELRDAKKAEGYVVQFYDYGSPLNFAFTMDSTQQEERFYRRLFKAMEATAALEGITNPFEYEYPDTPDRFASAAETRSLWHGMFFVDGAPVGVTVFGEQSRLTVRAPRESLLAKMLIIIARGLESGAAKADLASAVVTDEEARVLNTEAVIAGWGEIPPELSEIAYTFGVKARPLATKPLVMGAGEVFEAAIF
jgi:hypothetical protein